MLNSKCRRAILVSVIVSFGVMAADNTVAATKAAEGWLALVDSDKYGESWDSASSYFKKAVTKEQWTTAVTVVRTQVGKFESRKLSTTQAMKNPPNAPEGDYILLQYTSNFANKNEATETVVLMRDRDNQWRTSGYFVK